MTTAIVTRQEELENHAMTEGRERYQRRIAEAQKKGNMASTGAGKSLVLDAIQPLSNAMLAALEVKKRGVRHIAEIVVPVVGAEVAAYMTVRTALNECLRHQAVGIVALELADLMLDELRYRRFKAQAPALWDYKLKQFKTGSYLHKQRSLDFTLRTAQTVAEDGSLAPIKVDDLELSDTQRMALGMWCINHLVVATELVYVKTSSQYRKGKVVTIKSLEAPQETLDWLKDRNEALELLWPVALPMVEPPLPWSADKRGGYRHALRGKYPLVRGVSKGHAQVLAGNHMPVVYDALNAIQNTAWCINQPVAAVVKELVERGGGHAGIPLVSPVSLPPRPVEVEEFELQRKVHRKHLKQTGEMLKVSAEMQAYLDEWKGWKKKAGRIKDANHMRSFQRTALLRLLDVVKRLHDEPTLYFVYNLDFRGRVYPVASTLLSPQGDDLSKGLLKFAEARPLGRSGRRYLAQHGAACLDDVGGLKLSKLSIEDRVQYIERNSGWIEQMALDPQTHRDWMAADSPVCFLAFCMEWAAMMQWVRQGNSEDSFLSALPCAQDGSCNGIQHFSAMLRDPVGGAAVNLVPADLPQDIYTQVMNAVLDILQADAGHPEQLGTVTRITKTRRGGKMVPVEVTSPGRGTLALMWLTSGLVTRKLVKRPVMTFPYGSRAFGFSSQILQYMQHMGNDAADHLQAWNKARAFFYVNGDPKQNVVKDASQYLAIVIMEALESTVVAAAEAMDWLRRSARTVAGQGVCVQWTVPVTGFKVSQEYMETKERQVQTLLLGKLYKPVVHVDTETPNAVKQGNAVAPNVVHSLDAAALMMTVRMAKGHGVSSFAMVHDSYGAPAGDCEVLAQCTRSAFVSLYSDTDVVQGLHDQLKAQVTDEKVQAKLPAMPAKGTLDLSGVHACDFFFA